MARKPEPGKSPKAPKSPAAKNKKANSPAKNHGPAGHKPAAHDQPRFIVGIGASAGGFEAYSQFFAKLPPDTGMAFIIVQHLDPVHESILPELLAKMTRMPVKQVEEGMPLKANEVYVISPNTDLAVARGRLKITARGDKRPSMSIDHLLRSLAADQKDQAVGLIFSGTSSDGALGIEAIKHAGGTTFAQDEASARYSFMPNAAVATGCVDFILHPGEMAKELAKISRHPFWSYYQTPSAVDLPETEQELEQILLFLQKATGVNFTYYKRSTLRRRITRRLVLHKLENLEDYLTFLQKNPKEVEALYQDVLIKVTGFFRDEGAFDILKKEVFPEILAAKSKDSSVRFWVPGCSSGEEAYSLAMSWLEFMGDQAPAVPIQIFATDVSEVVIDKARLGFYLENIASDLSPERLSRFFVKANGGYQINKTIRDICVFARQNLIQDPPFSKLDLISCRNVLIYLQTALQKRLIPMFHFSLNPTGYLMLGASETVGAFTELFALMDKKYKIYRKKSALAPARLDFLPPRSPREQKEFLRGPAKMEEPWSKQNLYTEADRLILSRFAPAGVLINADLDILQFRGQTGPYLEPAPGEASFKLMRMAREGLLLGLRTAVAQALKKSETVKMESLRVDYDGLGRMVDLEVIPLKPGPAKERFFLVLFEETAPPARPAPGAGLAPETSAKKPGAKDRLILGLRKDLAALKEHLNAMSADKESTNEELRAANEEILSANEEFQSVNEELETAKEELQSANEELTSLNEELNVRNTELTQLNNDYNNLILSSNIPIIMLGRDLRIRHITPQAHELFNLIPGDVGRPLSDLKLNLEITGLEALAREVIDTLAVKTQEVRDSQEHWFRLHIRPYYTLDKKIEGVVITLVDIHELKANLLQLKQHQDLIQGVYTAMGEALLVLDRDLRVKMANPAFYKTFQMTPEETAGLPVYELGSRQWDIPELRKLLEDILPRDTTFQNFPLEHDFPGVGRLSFLLNGCRLTREQSAAGEDLILLTMTNVTELQKTRESLKESETRRHLNSRLRTDREKECPILAWELRDLINRDLGSLDKSLRDIVQKLAVPEKKTRYEKALTQIEEIAATLLGITWDAPPTILRHLGFTAALKNLVSEFHRYFHIEAKWDIDELNHLFTGESRNLIYRVLVEALYNIGRHSEATQAAVAIKKKGNQVSFQVKDNGKGFNLTQVRKKEAAKKGAGLPAMEARVRRLGGELKIWSKEGKGTQLTFSLPVKK